MRFLSTLLAGALAAGVLLLGVPSMAFASSGDAPSPSSATVDERMAVAVQPGTDAETASYELREQESADVQEFAGGAVFIGVSLVFIIVVVLIILILSD
jgi:hypothetical protein